MWQYNHTISSEEEQYLMHYGVKGMKWRKRKAVGPQYNTPAAQRQMRSMNLPQANASRKNLRGYASKVSQRNKATVKVNGKTLPNPAQLQRIQRARKIEEKYGKGTYKAMKAIVRDQKIQDAKANAKLKARQTAHKAKQGIRSGVASAKAKGNQAVSSLKAEINKRKRVSAAKKTAKARLKKYKNSTTGYQRRIK